MKLTKVMFFHCDTIRAVEKQNMILRLNSGAIETILHDCYARGNRMLLIFHHINSRKFIIHQLEDTAVLGFPAVRIAIDMSLATMVFRNQPKDTMLIIMWYIYFFKQRLYGDLRADSI